jgi:hypothetical protein
MNTVFATQEKIAELDIKWNDGDSTEIGSAGDMRSSGRSNVTPTDFGAALLPTKRIKMSPERRPHTPDTLDPVAMAGLAFGSAVSMITPFAWRAHAVDSVALSENGTSATQIGEQVKQRTSSNVCMGKTISETTEMVLWSLTTGTEELIKGKHYILGSGAYVHWNPSGAHRHKQART